jgi:phospholipase C
VVSQAPSTVALTSSLNPSTYGQAVTLTATVSAASGPTGYVIFKNGTESLGGVALVGGVASLTTSTLGVGTLSITAVYPGTPFFAGSTSPTLTQVVAQADSTVALVSSLNPSTYGQAVTLTATVSSASGTPAGYVTFSAGNTWLGNVTLAGGVANFTTTTLAAGTLPITAVYPGTANFSAGSASMMQQVMPVVAHDYALTATALNPGFVIAGNASASTVTVTPENGYTGSVRLSCSVIIGGSPAPTCVFNPSSVTISDINPGTATLTVSTSSSTPAGNDSILVSAGDSNNLAPINGSQTLMLATVPAGSLGYGLTTTALNPGFVTPGTSSTAAVTVTPLNGYTGSISLSCSVTSGGGPAPNCAFNPPSVTISDINPGTATLAVSTASSTPAGNDSISVSAVDANNLPPVNGPQTLTLATAVIQHIVIIFQENRTPDNLFQDPVLISRGADIVGSGMNSLGQAIPLSPIDLGFAGVNPNNYDLGHNHQSFVSMYDGGKMDGADLIYCNPTAPAQCPPNAQFMYVNPADVQPYFALAEQYTFGDRMFQTNQGPSFPSHQFIISGTSAPTAGSPLFAAENPTLNNAGCIAPLSTLVTMIDATGSETNPAPQYPCFEHATLTDLLDANGLTWHYYTPAPGSIWTGPDAIEHICQEQPINGILTCTGPDWNNNVIIPQTQVLTDIANGQLPQVSWVIPNGTSSDHAAINDGSGPSWVASVVNAIGNSSYWANTAIIITWDDWGGWYDHVAPTVINDGVSWGSGNVYGFRVPLIVVSPYAKAGYVSHVTHDFGSILKFIENNFNLPSLGYADGPADNLADCFDFTQTPSSFQAIPAPLGALDFINDKRPPTAPDDD